MSEEKLLNLLKTETKRNQVRGWLKDGKKSFIERLLKDESEEARMEFQRLKSSNCFKQYFIMGDQREIAKMERDEQWDQLRNFVRAQGNRNAIDEHSKWEQRNGIVAVSSPVSRPVVPPKPRGKENHINNASSSTQLPSKQNQNIQHSQKLPKETDKKWTFLIPVGCYGLVIGKGGQHVKRYNQQKYVEIPCQMDPKPLRVEGFDTSFDNVFYVCMDIWKRIVATYKEISRHSLPMPLSVRIDKMNPKPFQQLLFMEDYNVLLRSLFLY